MNTSRGHARYGQSVYSFHENRVHIRLINIEIAFGAISAWKDLPTNDNKPKGVAPEWPVLNQPALPSMNDFVAADRITRRRPYRGMRGQVGLSLMRYLAIVFALGKLQLVPSGCANKSAPSTQVGFAVPVVLTGLHDAAFKPSRIKPIGYAAIILEPCRYLGHRTIWENWDGVGQSQMLGPLLAGMMGAPTAVQAAKRRICKGLFGTG